MEHTISSRKLSYLPVPIPNASSDTQKGKYLLNISNRIESCKDRNSLTNHGLIYSRHNLKQSVCLNW